MDENGLLTQNQVAKLSGVTAPAVAGWVKRGKLTPEFELVGKIRLFRAEEVQNFLASWSGKRAHHQQPK